MEPLAINLVAAGLVAGASRGKDWAVGKIQDQKYSDDLPKLETLLNDALRDAVMAVAQEKENTAILDITQHWGTVAEELDDVTVAFGNPEAAVEEITDRIMSADAVGLEDENRADVVEVVTAAYDYFFQEFESRVSGTPLADELNSKLGRSISAQVAELADELDRIAEAARPPSRYERFDPEDVERAVETFVPPDDVDVEFVDRPELEETPDVDRLLVAGPAGSGKTRTLEALLRRRAPSVAHVIVPKADELNYPQDQYAFERASFDGDVVLAWDDVHKINEEQDNTVFDDVLRKLDSTLAEQGHDLHVLAASRSGEIEYLPGKGVESSGDIERRRHGLWGDFEVLRLESLPVSNLRTIAERLADEREVRFADGGEAESVIEALVAKTKPVPDAEYVHESAPNYVDAVLRASETEELTESDIEELPADAVDVWRDQYGKLGDDHELAVVRSCGILYDIGLPYYSWLVFGIYEHLDVGVDGSRGAFIDAVGALEGRQWIRVPSEDRIGDDVTYWLHDTQAEAADRRLARDGRTSLVSAFLLDYLTEYVPETDDRALRREVIHGTFASTVQSLDDIDDEIAEDHYKRILEEIDDVSPIIHYNYANLLFEKPEAEWDRADDHYRRALKLTSDTDDPLDSTNAKAHYNYASLLASRQQADDRQDARKHLERSVALWSERGKLANVLNDSRLLVRVCEELEETDAAIEHCDRAISVAKRVGDEDAVLEFRGQRALLSGRGMEKAIPERYWVGLERVRTAQGEGAVQFFSAAWQNSGTVDGDTHAHRFALSAGVWLAVLDLLFEGIEEDVAEEVQNAVDDTLESLSPVVTALYRTAFTDETGAKPFELRQRLDLDDRFELEIDAYERLLSVANE